MMHINSCQSVLYVAKQVRRSDRGVGANVSLVQMGHNGSDRRIWGRRWQPIPQIRLVGKNQQRYLQPSPYGHKNGGDT